MSGLKYLRDQSTNRQLVLFLGSNIGNFDKDQSLDFLRHLWSCMQDGDYLLSGFDLKKNVDTLTKAYNDSSGYTKAFNLNLLDRMNDKLGANFDRSKFEHHGFYNPVKGAMESCLLSTDEQSVYISKLNKEFHFKSYEPIHLEYSFKYTDHEIDFLAKETGFDVEKHFTDKDSRFIDSLWKVTKD